MIFPIYNIGSPSLGKDFWLRNEYLWFDPIFVSSDLLFWKEHFEGRHFVDCQGRVYVLSGRTRVKKWWYRLFGITRYICHFTQTSERRTLQEILNIIEGQIKQSESPYKEALILELRKSTTIRELILWETVDIKRLQKGE